MFPPLQSRMYTLSTQRIKLEDANQPALLIPLSRRMRLPSTRSQKMGSSPMCCAMVRSGSDTISWLAGPYIVPCRLKWRQLSRTLGVCPFEFAAIWGYQHTFAQRIYRLFRYHWHDIVPASAVQEHHRVCHLLHGSRSATTSTICRGCSLCNLGGSEQQ